MTGGHDRINRARGNTLAQTREERTMHDYSVAWLWLAAILVWTIVVAMVGMIYRDQRDRAAARDRARRGPWG
jgi:hypothetical protein